MSINADGRHGEELARRWLKERGLDHFQADWIARSGANDFIVEAKYQERYKAPPFDGHGLPEQQVQARLDFHARHGIPTLFLVFDKGTGEEFYEWLHVLDAGEKLVTPVKRRVVYPLSSFRVSALPEKRTA